MDLLEEGNQVELTHQPVRLAPQKPASLASSRAARTSLGCSVMLRMKAPMASGASSACARRMSRKSAMVSAVSVVQRAKGGTRGRSPWISRVRTAWRSASGRSRRSRSVRRTGLRDLGQRRPQHGGVLPDIERRQVEAEEADLVHQRLDGAPPAGPPMLRQAPLYDG